jgi:sugar lactone lactonase YvrE
VQLRGALQLEPLVFGIRDSAPEPDVAVDSSGNLFVTDYGQGEVLEESPSGGGGYSPSVVASGLANPLGVAVDSSGDVFVAASNQGTVFEESPSGGGDYSQSVVASGFSAPYGVAVDSSGNVFGGCPVARRSL